MASAVAKPPANLALWRLIFRRLPSGATTIGDVNRIESLLSARLFLSPHWVGDRIIFLSNLGGHLSLYAMEEGGSVPEPLLPPHIALQTPALVDGHSFFVFPGIDRILVMIDADGDENYQPMLVPIGGGYPELAFGDHLAGYRVHCIACDAQRNLVYLGAESRREPVQVAYRGDLGTGTLRELGRSAYGCSPAAYSPDHAKVALIDGYAAGDTVLYLWEEGAKGARLLHGTPLEARRPGEKVPLSAIEHPSFSEDGEGLLFVTALFEDTYGLGYMDLRAASRPNDDGSLGPTGGPDTAGSRVSAGGRSSAGWQGSTTGQSTSGGQETAGGWRNASRHGTAPGASDGGATSGVTGRDARSDSAPQEVARVAISGTVHEGKGELVGVERLKGSRYLVEYNIDGCSWLYEGSFDRDARRMALDAVVCGRGALAGGVLEGNHYDRPTDRFALAFSSATSPTQIHTVEGAERKSVRVLTRERVLGLPAARLSQGEDASFVSFDGLRIPARLYMPAAELGFKGARPVAYYLHGGPQSQERPNFAWFSIPLIQFLTLKGFAVFVPNARGSTGYGLDYTKRVDRDWGGKDRLDHVEAMKVLAKDRRLDATRAAVVGRSYGGYMTLTLAARHPELWSAAVDMFGPFDLLTFSERIPETWKPYFDLALGHPVKDREFLIERSPKTWIEALRCPLLVIQGRNDPRVVERESRDLVEHLRSLGKEVDYLVFENEGHDVIKFENRVRCYNAIADFFAKHLHP